LLEGRHLLAKDRMKNTFGAQSIHDEYCPSLETTYIRAPEKKGKSPETKMSSEKDKRAPAHTFIYQINAPQ